MMRRKSRDSPIRWTNVAWKLSTGVVKFDSDRVLQTVIGICE